MGACSLGREQETFRRAPHCSSRLSSDVLPRHVYVHVPFCARRCAYCDFAIAVRREIPVGDYLAALRREIALRHAPAQRWPVDTIYLGGGTPSLLGGPGVRDALDLLREQVDLAPGAEVTIEANPDDVTPGAIAGWRSAGVNRLSIGAQSFDERVLAWMHRTHTAEAIGRAVAVARDGGIDNLSLDLIFSLPEAIPRDWARDVELAIELQPDHLSLYGLTIETHTPLGRWRDRGDVREAPEERYEEEYLLAHTRLAAAGLDHYEVSNFGRPGRHSRHNSSYWRSVPYAGLGPSAHEFDGVRRRWNLAAYESWRTHLERGEDPLGGAETLDASNRLSEAVYLGLRTRDGVALMPGELELTQPWVAAGWARVESGRLRLTALGWLRLDALAADLTLRRSLS